jgi:hypothetical protein
MELAQRIEYLKKFVSESQKPGKLTKYPSEIKDEAVAVASKIGIRRLSNETGICYGTADTWVRIAKKRALRRIQSSAKKQALMNSKADADAAPDNFSVTRVSLCQQTAIEDKSAGCIARITNKNGQCIDLFDANFALKVLVVLQSEAVR